MPTIAKRRKRPKRKKLTNDEKAVRRAQRRFQSDIRTTFTNAGFTHVPTRDKEIGVAGRAAEFDGIFVQDNVLVVVEETLLASGNIPDHLRKKTELYRHCKSNEQELIRTLRRQFPPLDAHFRKNPHVTPEHCIVEFLYCARYDVDASYRTRYAGECRLLQYPHLQYFLRLSRTIHRSARYELFKFLDIQLEDVVGPVREEVHRYRALRLPAVESGFPPGYQLISFLVDPKTLIERAYVLRADSWRDQDALYQRLLVKGKISSMREYLVDQRRVFVNNIIVTLPSGTQFDRDDVAGRRRPDGIAVGSVQIPRQFNAIGIVDGQHRVFSYHEGDDRHEAKIAVLRDQQHLLVTGIIYPADLGPSKAREFEARLFLEINDKQKRVRGDLKQGIERIVNPYSPVAIAKAVIEKLAETGPLVGMLETHFFDVGKLKTTSIVGYGLRHIVAIDGESSFFDLWRDERKAKVAARMSKRGLEEYIDFVAAHLRLMLAGFRSVVGNELWTLERRKSRALSTTTINGLVFCMRRLIENGRVGTTFEYYRDAFARSDIDFRPSRFTYRSSHWRALGDRLFTSCFDHS